MIFLMSVPFVTNAQAPERTLAGCFERSATTTDVTVWLTAPTCSIILTNTTTESVTSPTMTIWNLDPDFYHVTTTDGSEVTITENETSLSFQRIVAPATQETITIQPWDYDDNDNDFWFGVISDTQAQPGGAVPNPIFEEIMEKLEPLHLPFILAAGDMVKGSSTDTAVHLDEYERNDEIFRAYEGSTFAIPGTHDARQDLDTYYSAFFGPRNYTFTYGNTRIVGLSLVESGGDGPIDDQTYQWLEQTLTSNTKENLFVFAHQPLIGPSWADYTGLSSEDQLLLGGLFDRTGVDTYLSGHVHGYDYRIIDNTMIPTVTHGFSQLIAGGAGGDMYNYGGDNFFVLVHVGPNGITHVRMDLSTFDLSIDEESRNDGSQEQVMVSLLSNSSVMIPFLRLKANVLGDKTPYVHDTAGNYFALAGTAWVHGKQRAFVQFEDLAADFQRMFTFGLQRTLLQGITNRVDSDGAITFDTLPTAENTLTTLTVSTSTADAIITIDQWDSAAHHFRWREESTIGATTTYLAKGMHPNRRYGIIVNDALVDRATADTDGSLTFSVVANTEKSDIHLLPLRLRPTIFGVLPASAGGSQIRLFRDDGSVATQFFATDQNISGGFQAIWADVTGDGVLELVITSTQATKENGRVFVYTKYGDLVGSFTPFGPNTKGMELVAADIDGDLRDEIVVSRGQEGRSVMRIFRFSDDTLDFEKLLGFRSFGKKYTGGVHMSAGDFDSDQRMELVVTPHTIKKTARVYRLAKTGKRMKLLAQWKPFARKSGVEGFVSAVGDVNADGRDELIVAPRSDGESVIVYAQSKESGRFRKQVAWEPFSEPFSGEMQLSTGDIDGIPGDEIVVAQHSAPGSLLRIFQRAEDGSFIRIGGIYPFGRELREGLTVGFADVNGDGQEELAVTSPLREGRLRVYALKDGSLLRRSSVRVYDEQFAGGLSITY